MFKLTALASLLSKKTGFLKRNLRLPFLSCPLNQSSARAKSALRPVSSLLARSRRILPKAKVKLFIKKSLFAALLIPQIAFTQNRQSAQYNCQTNSYCLNKLYKKFLNKKSPNSIYSQCKSHYSKARYCCKDFAQCNLRRQLGFIKDFKKKGLEFISSDIEFICGANTPSSFFDFVSSNQGVFCDSEIKTCRSGCSKSLNNFKTDFKKCFKAPDSLSIDDMLQKAWTLNTQPCWKEMLETALRYKNITLGREKLLRENINPEDIVSCQDIKKELTPATAKAGVKNLCQEAIGIKNKEKEKKAREEERRRKAEEERKRKAEERRRKAEEERKRQAEERRRKAEERRRKAEEERKRQAEEERKRQAEEKRKRREEAERKRQAEEERKRQAEERRNRRLKQAASPEARQARSRTAKIYSNYADQLAERLGDPALLSSAKQLQEFASENRAALDEALIKQKKLAKHLSRLADAEELKIAKNIEKLKKSHEAAAKEFQQLQNQYHQALRAERSQKEIKDLQDKIQTAKQEAERLKAQHEKSRQQLISNKKKIAGILKNIKETKEKLRKKTQEIKDKSEKAELLSSHLEGLKSCPAPPSIKANSLFLLQGETTKQMDLIAPKGEEPYELYELSAGKPAGIEIHFSYDKMSSKREFSTGFYISGSEKYYETCFHSPSLGKKMNKGRKAPCSFIKADLQTESWKKFLPLPMNQKFLKKEGDYQVKFLLFPVKGGGKSCIYQKPFYLRIAPGRQP